MRTWFLGCLSLVSVTLSATAWCAEDAPKEDPKATAEPASPGPAPAPPPPAKPAGKTESKSVGGAAAPAAKGEVRVTASGAAASGAASASSSASPPAPATAAPSSPKVEPVAVPEGSAGPKPLPEGIAPPMPPETGPLPPLPNAVPAYDAPSPLPPPPVRRRVEWGTQVRLEGAAKGDGAADNAGMGGIGFSFRPRPSPYFAVDLGLDFLGGRDFDGNKRAESAFTVNPMVFLNPRNTVQVYLFGGLGLGGARVERSDGSHRNFRYIGADAGVGVEMRFWTRVALSADVLAFVRDRIDLKDSAPEYVEAGTGRYTDSSAGALFRLGGIYYW